jgi:oligoribonuclease
MDKKLANKKQTRLLWIDLEMTGLNPLKDRIIEVGVIVTDWNFNELAVFETVIHQPSLIMAKMDEWNTTQHGKSGLTERVKESSISEKAAEAEVIAILKEHFPKDIPVILAGNSIHMDRRFIISRWPKLDAYLHYRMLDVSAWKIVFEGKFGKKFAKPESHRALEDIRGSIEELKYYLAKLTR